MSGFFIMAFLVILKLNFIEIIFIDEIFKVLIHCHLP